MPKRNIMEEFTMHEISAVDRPAQEHAKALIQKRDSGAKTKSEDGKDFPASDYAYVPDPDQPSTWKLRLTSTPGGAPDPGIVGAAAAALGKGYRGNKVEIPAGDRAAVVARVRAAWKKANPDKEDDAMPEGIAKSAEEQEEIEKRSELASDIIKRFIDPADGAISFADAMQNEFEQQQYWELQQKCGAAISALTTSLRSIQGDADMDPNTKDAMLRASVEQFLAVAHAQWPEVESIIQGVANPASGNDNVMKGKKDMAEKDAKDLEKRIADLEKQAASDKERADKAEAELKTEKAKAAMTDAEKECFNSMDDDKSKMDFLNMSHDDRKKVMSKKAEGDETIKIDGREIKKSVVGAEQFEVFKSQEARLAKQAEQLAQEQELRKNAEFTKIAGETLGNLPGKVEDKVGVLKAMEGMEKSAREALTAMLTAGDKAIKSAFDTIGHQGGFKDPAMQKGVEEAKKSFNTHVAEIAKRDGIGKSEALSKARREYADEFKVAYPDNAN